MRRVKRMLNLVASVSLLSISFEISLPVRNRCIISVRMERDSFSLEDFRNVTTGTRRKCSLQRYSVRSVRWENARRSSMLFDEAESCRKKHRILRFLLGRSGTNEPALFRHFPCVTEFFPRRALLIRSLFVRRARYLRFIQPSKTGSCKATT